MAVDGIAEGSSHLTVDSGASGCCHVVFPHSSQKDCTWSQEAPVSFHARGEGQTKALLPRLNEKYLACRGKTFAQNNCKKARREMTDTHNECRYRTPDLAPAGGGRKRC